MKESATVRRRIRRLERLYRRYLQLEVPRARGLIETWSADVDLFEEDGYLAGLVDSFLRGRRRPGEILLDLSIDRRLRQAPASTQAQNTMKAAFLEYRSRMHWLAAALSEATEVPLQYHPSPTVVRRRSELQVVGDVDGEDYRRLLRWAAEFAPLGLLVVRPELELDDLGAAILRRLEPYVVSRSRQKGWPGTQLFEEEAEIVIFELVLDALELLTAEADSFFDWQQPRLPEDLCILRMAEDPILVTTAHEGYLVLRLWDDELEALRSTLPGQAASLVTMAQEHVADPKVVELLQRALDGNLGFDDLYREWPLPETVAEGLYSSILEDLATAVEHTPGFFFARGVDQKAWIGSPEYNQVYLDLRLLQSGLPLARIERIRSEAQDLGLDAVAVERLVAGETGS